MAATKYKVGFQGNKLAVFYVNGQGRVFLCRSSMHSGIVEVGTLPSNTRSCLKQMRGAECDKIILEIQAQFGPNAAD